MNVDPVDLTLFDGPQPPGEGHFADFFEKRISFFWCQLFGIGDAG